jgi:hypothetical protein
MRVLLNWPAKVEADAADFFAHLIHLKNRGATAAFHKARTVLRMISALPSLYGLSPARVEAALLNCSLSALRTTRRLDRHKPASALHGVWLI